MDKYHGVFVKIVLNNNDTVKGRIYGKDDNGNLLLKNATTERANGHNSSEDMLPIITTLIKDLEVLDMNNEEVQPSTTPQPPQTQTQPNQQQMYMQQQEQFKQQQMLNQQQQQFQQMQQHPFPQQPFHPMHQYQSPMPFQPSPHAPHIDPAILFQHSMNQANNPLMPRDPAIISSQQQSYDGAQKNDKSSMNNGSHMSSIDPAILFTQSAGTRQQYQQATNSSNTPNIVQNMFQQQSQQQEQKKQQQQQQQKQKQNASSNLKSLDPSILFQQASKPIAEKSSSSVPFQDPAIISVTSTPEIKDNKPKNPLFGGKKVKKAAKEVVVYEDYSDFESGKSGIKKIQPTKKNAEANANNSNSNTSTPVVKKKNKEDQKPSAFNEALPAKPAKQPKSVKSPPIEVLSKQTNTPSPSSVPTSLIPPKARRSNSSTPQPPQLPQQQQQQQQFTKNNTAVEPARILTVSGGIQIPIITSGQMESVKNVAREAGLTQAQLVENGAFGISMMVLKAIGGHRRIQPDNHNAAPVVVVLAGPTSIGEFGIAAARHLANRGCQVIVSVTSDSYCGASVEQYKALAKFSSARIVSSIDELPNQYTTPVDLIVDTLLGSEIKSMSAAIKSQMNWANANKAPVLSIDFPSGVHPDIGSFPNNSSNHITPKWTLCLGAPYTGCTSRSVTGELFLADSGLPFNCFQSVVRNFHIPWGSDFVLALEYA